MTGRKTLDYAIDPNFSHILSLSARSYVTPEQLMNEKLPASLTFRETWETLTSIRRATAITVPFQEEEEFDSWYVPTLHITQSLGRLERRCCSDSSLTRYAQKAKSSDIYAESLADEIIGIVMHDNVKLDRAATVQFLIMRYAPRNDCERLLRNIYTLTESLEEYRDVPFSASLTNEVYSRIIAGVDPSQLDLPPTTDQLETHSTVKHWASEAEHLDAIFSYANGQIGDPYDSPLIRAAFLRTFFSYHHPLPSMNHTVGRFLFALLCLKHDLPFACMVPYSEKLFHWLADTRHDHPHSEDKHISTLSGSVPSAFDARGKSSDYTAFVTLALDLLEEAVGETEQRIRQQEEGNRLVENMLSGTFMVNHRQQAILSRALRNPHEAFLIRQHRIDQNIAYGTARSDLLELVHAGFLVQVKEGKRFVFRPSPDLPEKLRNMAQILEPQGA